jgi:hypothetical protein
MNSAVFGAFSAFGNDTEAYGNIRGVGTKMGTLDFVLCHNLTTPFAPTPGEFVKL